MLILKINVASNKHYDGNDVKVHKYWAHKHMEKSQKQKCSSSRGSFPQTLWVSVKTLRGDWWYFQRVSFTATKSSKRR